jgi:hypothetical protein
MEIDLSHAPLALLCVLSRSLAPDGTGCIPDAEIDHSYRMHMLTLKDVEAGSPPPCAALPCLKCQLYDPSVYEFFWGCTCPHVC